MSDFAEIGELLTREYGSNMEHLYWCGTDKQDIPWKECSLAKQHEDAGIDISMRVMCMEMEQENG